MTCNGCKYYRRINAFESGKMCHYLLDTGRRRRIATSVRKSNAKDARERNNMGGRMSREKGKRGERELASKLREYGYNAKRGVQYKGSPESPDVAGLPGVHIEVKRTEKLSLYDALAQSRADAGGDMPVVIHRKNNCEWVVIQPLKDWMELYREWETAQISED